VTCGSLPAGILGAGRDGWRLEVSARSPTELDVTVTAPDGRSKARLLRLSEQTAQSEAAVRISVRRMARVLAVTLEGSF
jgi:hypothetical protein